MTVTLYPSQIGGTAAAPPSKSAGHRALVCAALADGTSRIEDLPFSRDIEATRAAVAQLGARTARAGDALTVQGIGTGGFATVTRPVFCDESGSTLRFLIPLFSLTAQKVVFTGAGRLFARPQSVYKTLFEDEGLRFAQAPDRLTVQGRLRAGAFTVPGDVSSQFISGLLFAAPLLEGKTTITVTPPFESRSYVGMTLDALRAFGIQVQARALPGGGARYTVAPQPYRPCTLAVEGDYSQAAFLAALGALCAPVTVTGLAARTCQGDAVILALLRRFGARVEEGLGAVTVRPAPLTGIELDLADCPDLGPVLMALACFAGGDTTIRHAGRLRLKESDRIAAMQQELAKLGAAVEADADTVTVHGGAALRAPSAPLCAHNDHRVAMSLAVAALGAGVPAVLEGAGAVDKSWPAFFAVLRALGARLEEQDG